MAYEQKPNTGILSRNEKMREGKQDAEFTGSALIDGVEYWLNGWVNEFKSGPNQGKKYFSIKFNPKQQQSGGSSQQSRQAPPDDVDIPF
jgi:hypothetical protein